jgi:hypothetical protein
VSEYWFARYTLAPSRGRAIKALSWQGWATIALFLAAMVGGGLLFAALVVAGQVALGIIAFALCAIAGAAFFIWAAVAKSDPVRTVADYQKDGRLV